MNISIKLLKDLIRKLQKKTSNQNNLIMRRRFFNRLASTFHAIKFMSENFQHFELLNIEISSSLSSKISTLPYEIVITKRGGQFTFISCRIFFFVLKICLWHLDLYLNFNLESAEFALKSSKNVFFLSF